MAKRLPLPVKRTMNLTEDAYARLRELNEKYGLGNNYLLTVLLENYDELVDAETEARVFKAFFDEYGDPKGRVK